MKIYRVLKRWHKRIGIAAAFFVILLVITGVALNHTEQLKLDQNFIGSSLLLDWYNISPPEAPVSFATENHRVSLLGNRLYFNDQELEDRAGKLLGVLEINDSIIVATPEAILLLDQKGELIEILTSAEGVPAGMQRIGYFGVDHFNIDQVEVTQTTEDQFIIEAVHGNYQVDIDQLTWKKISIAEINWSESSALTDPLKTSLLKAYRGKGLSIERVLLDLHSGRVLGNFGVFLIDAAALLFLVLAITGVWMWSRKL